PVPETLPDRWMTGTQNHEGLAGVIAAVEYLADLDGSPGGSRPEHLRRALSTIQAEEARLARQLLQGLAERPRFRVWGITDPARLAERVPTVSVTRSDR